MKLIVQIYHHEERQSVWFLDTKNLPGNPPVLRIHVDTFIQPTEKEQPPCDSISISRTKNK